jgi:hypothetical protein
VKVTVGVFTPIVSDPLKTYCGLGLICGDLTLMACPQTEKHVAAKMANMVRPRIALRLNLIIPAFSAIQRPPTVI